MDTEKPQFCHANLLTASGVVVTSSAEEAEYPAGYALHPWPTKVYRSTTTTGAQWWKADLLTAQAMTCALIRGWARPGTGQIKFQANATDAWTSPTIDVAFTLPTSNPTQVIALFFDQQSLRWVRFYSPNAGATSGYFELGVPFVGTTLELSRGVRPGPSFPLVDPSLIVESPDGQKLVMARSLYAGFRAEFGPVRYADAVSFQAMYRTVGVRTPIFFALYPPRVDQILYGRLSAMSEPRHVSGTSDSYAFAVSFEEER